MKISNCNKPPILLVIEPSLCLAQLDHKESPLLHQCYGNLNKSEKTLGIEQQNKNNHTMVVVIVSNMTITIISFINC